MREADGALAVEEMYGASNVVYKVNMLKDALCSVHCLLDDDKSGRLAYKELMDSGIIGVGDVTVTKVQGFDEAEFEDLIDPAIYKEKIQTTFRIDIENHPKFKGKGKWSSRMKSVLETSGKPWNASTESQVKSLVSKAVEAKPEAAIAVHRAELVAALVKELEVRLGEVEIAM